MPPRKTSLALLLTIALAGSAVVLIATSTFGIGISAESETYVLAALNYTEGRGLVVPTSAGGVAPLTQHAPLYAAVLGLCGRAGIDVVAAARWLGALSFGALALMAGLTVRSLSKRVWLAPIAATLVLCSVPILNLHLTALSESLFLIGVLAGLHFLVRYLQTAELRWLVVSSLACAAALLTRYAGISAVAAGFLGVWLYDRSHRREAAAVVFAVISCFPTAMWALYTTAHAGNPVARKFAMHPISAGDAATALRTLSTWILPGVVAPALRFVVLAAILLWLGGLLYRVGSTVPCRLFLWFMALYTVTIAIAKSFFDAAIPLDDRLLSPLYIPAIVAGALAVDHVNRVIGRRALLVVPAALTVIALAGFNLGRELPCLATMYRSGREYNGAAWRQSPLAGWLHSVAPETPVYSNLDSAVRFLHRGVIRGLPPKADVRSGLPNVRYPDDFQRFRAQLVDSSGVVVYFTNSPVPEAFLPTLPELIQQLHLTEVARGDTWIALRPEKGRPNLSQAAVVAPRG